MKKTKLKALIVDDEKEARELLHHYLNNNPDIAVIEEAESAEEALFKYIDFSPDIIFLDLVMPGKDGIDFIQLLKKREMDCNIVIVTAYKDLVITAIKNHIYDFILKPVDIEDINRVIEKFSLKNNTSIDDKLNKALKHFDQGIKIKISTTNSHILIDPNEIIYCEAEGSYTVIFLENGIKELANSNLGRIERILPVHRFFRIGRSFLINLDKLTHVNRGDNSCILTVNKKEFKLCGSRKQIKILCEMDFE